jgi:hypothetical protein
MDFWKTKAFTLKWTVYLRLFLSEKYGHVLSVMVQLLLDPRIRDLLANH